MVKFHLQDIIQVCAQILTKPVYIFMVEEIVQENALMTFINMIQKEINFQK